MTTSPGERPPDPASAPLVRGQGIVKRFGSVTALAGATFEIDAGITGLLGANGAGKTTLLSALLGLHRLDAGNLEVLGSDPWRTGPALRGDIGYAPEHDALPPDFRATDFVRHMAELHGIPASEATGRASDALYLVGLGEERFRSIGTMSTGQRQRVKLAQAISHDPALVLLDEPTSGLDPVQRDEMLRLIVEVGHGMGLNIILSSHVIGEVERVCDAVTILDAGRIAAQGRMEELRAAGREVVVEVDGGVKAFLTALRSAGLRPVEAGGRVVVPLRSEKTYDLIRDAAVSARVGVRRLQRGASTLEDTYLGLS